MLRWEPATYRKNKYDIVADVTSEISKSKGRFHICKTKGLHQLELRLNGERVLTGGLHETERLQAHAERML